MGRYSFPLVLFFAITLVIIVLSNMGLAEGVLGSHVRLVYFHGGWAWTALLGFLLAAAIGLVGLLGRQRTHQAWSVAIGQASNIFWLRYLPLSLWTIQMKWHGNFLQELRGRVNFQFAIIGVLLQWAITLMDRPLWGSILNPSYFLTLSWTLIPTEQIMHPGSPITTSRSITILCFFASLLVLCLLAGWFLTNWFRTLSLNPQ
ncbi:MAG: hypothetical protein A2Z14_14640 [Chloroflexi bacterium RBG_16_48_8]|nr:MAG: hypothetical protein A2Z14_14640 [Chloroflexi bacterium RBG_16_48_8]